MFLNVKITLGFLVVPVIFFGDEVCPSRTEQSGKKNFLPYESLLFDLFCIPYLLELGKDTLHSVLLRGAVLGQFSVNIYLPQ